MRIARLMKKSWQKAWVAFYRFFGRNYLCGCGHKAKWQTALTVDGNSGIYTLPSSEPEYCPKCWTAAAIKCAWCGKGILPNDPVTLYTPTEEFQVPEHAVIHKRAPHLQLVGCLRMGCTDTGADRAGFWVMPGKVHRVATGWEMLVANGGTEMVVVSDTFDPRQAVSIPDELT